MKFILVLFVVALYGAAIVTSFEVPEQDVETGSAEHLEAEPLDHPLIRSKRVSCDVGTAACNLHCQWKGYAKGSCRSNVCNCSGFSG